MSDIRAPERRQLTVMLCDLVDSTTLSVCLDAEELAELIQTYRQRCTTIIRAHGGTVAQYVGDGILVYFGFPLAHEDDAERAIRAAVAIATPSSAARDAASNVHIGIATGVVVVGDLGTVGSRLSPGAPRSTGREEISAVGNAPNLAARLQALAGPGMVVISEQTRRLAGGIFEYNDFGRHSVKGFEEPVQAWQVLGEGKVRSRFQALRASVLTPLVNRRSELSEFREIWKSVRAGRGRAVLLSSEPGIGKSRLAEVVAGEIVDRRCLRLWYYCSPHLQASPLAPVVRQLTLAAGFDESDDDDAKLDKLAAIIPTSLESSTEAAALIANLLSINYERRYPPLSMSTQRQKHRLFLALMQVLETFALRRPVLIVVEDLHWIDPSSDELVGILIDRLKALPVLAIFTARPEFDSHWDDGPHLVHMPLPPLVRSDSVAMIELLCGHRGIPEQTVNQIADQTDGLPLFIEDVTRDFLEVEALPGTESGLPLQRASLAFAIPATLTDSLMARLDRLGSSKRVAQIAATIGREFSYQVLARVAQLPAEDLKEHLHRLVESGLVIRMRSTVVWAYKFKHALVRDVAYSTLLKREQVALHKVIARLLAEEFPETGEAQPEILAHHFEAAHDIDAAVHYLIEAAKLSAKRSGFVEAVAQLQRCLSLLAMQPESSSRLRRELQVYLALGGVNAEYRGFSAGECGDAYIKALERCRRLEDAPEVFSVLSGVGSFQITRANFADCRALAEECLARAASQQSTEPFVMGHRLLGGTLFLTGELSRARAHLEEALRLYDWNESLPADSRVLYVQDHKSTSLCYLALTLTLMGYVDSGLRAAENSLTHSRSLGDLHTINFSLCYLAAVHHIQRDGPRALGRATESLQLAREQGFATFIGISQLIRGESLASNGDPENGLKEIAEGIKAHHEIEASAYQPFGISLFVKGLLAANRVDEALGALTQALGIAERTGERFYLAELWRLKGVALAKALRLAEAQNALRQAIDVARQQKATLLELRGAVTLCRLLDQPCRQTAQREVLEPLYRRFEESLDAPDLHDAKALLGEGPE